MHVCLHRGSDGGYEVCEVHQHIFRMDTPPKKNLVWRRKLVGTHSASTRLFVPVSAEGHKNFIQVMIHGNILFLIASIIHPNKSRTYPLFTKQAVRFLLKWKNTHVIPLGLSLLHLILPEITSHWLVVYTPVAAPTEVGTCCACCIWPWEPSG